MRRPDGEGGRCSPLASDWRQVIVRATRQRSAQRSVVECQSRACRPSSDRSEQIRRQREAEASWLLTKISGKLQVRIVAESVDSRTMTRYSTDRRPGLHARREVWCALLLFWTVAGAFALAQAKDEAEWAKLQGAWTVAAGEQNGRPNDAIKGGTLTIRDHAFSLKTASGAEFTGQLRIDASQSPMQLDFVHANGTVWQAIYSLNGDVFRLNYVEAGEQRTRPTLFATSAGGPGSIVVMRRAADGK